MVEPIATIGVSAIAAYLGKDGLQKILGPTADYLGLGLREFVQKRTETIGRIFHVAETKLGAQIEQPGEVPPKVLKEILEEGSFANDPLAVEYLGGILASSRTEAGRDDRGARMAKLVNRLSTYQLRTHYLFYASVQRVFLTRGLSMLMHDRPKMRMFIAYGSYIPTMEFSHAEISEIDSLLSHVLFGLHAEGLIEGSFMYAAKEYIQKTLPGANDGGIEIQPSALGTELFLWALGRRGKGLNGLFDPSFDSTVENMPDGFPDARATSDLAQAAEASQQ